MSRPGQPSISLQAFVCAMRSCLACEEASRRAPQTNGGCARICTTSGPSWRCPWAALTQRARRRDRCSHLPPGARAAGVQGLRHPSSPGWPESLPFQLLRASASAIASTVAATRSSTVPCSGSPSVRDASTRRRGSSSSESRPREVKARSPALPQTPPDPPGLAAVD